LSLTLHKKLEIPKNCSEKQEDISTQIFFKKNIIYNGFKLHKFASGAL